MKQSSERNLPCNLVNKKLDKDIKLCLSDAKVYVFKFILLYNEVKGLLFGI